MVKPTFTIHVPTLMLGTVESVHLTVRGGRATVHTQTVSRPVVVVQGRGTSTRRVRSPSVVVRIRISSAVEGVVYSESGINAVLENR